MSPPWEGWDIAKPLSELGFDSVQQALILEWYARRVWMIYEEANSYGPEYMGKSYDPLRLEVRSDGSVGASSYVLTFSGYPSTRHYEFASLDGLEKAMTRGLIEDIIADRNSQDEE